MEGNEDRVLLKLEELEVSAPQLAKVAGLQPKDIYYWLRKGFLKRPLVVNKCLPKLRLMALFAKRLRIEANKASELSEELLKPYVGKNNEFEATMALAEKLENGVSDFIDLVLDLDLVTEINEMMKKSTVDK